MSSGVSFIARHPWTTLGAILLVVAASVGGIVKSGLGTDNSIDVFLVEGDDEYERFERFRRQFGSNEILFLGVRGDVLSASGLERMAGLQARLEALDRRLAEKGDVSKPVVERIRGLHSFPIVHGLVEAQRLEEIKDLPLVGSSFLGKSQGNEVMGLMLVLVRKGLDGPDRGAFIGGVEKLLEEEKAAGWEVHAAGSPILNVNLDRASRGQSRKLFPFLALIAILVLWILTRSVRAALLILGTTVVTLPVTICALAATGHTMNMITTALPAVLLVLCSAASLHLFREFSLENKDNTTDPLAASRAQRHVLGPCLMASLTTALGFLSLALSDLRPIRQMGIFAAVGIIVSFAATMTLLPAALSLGFVKRRSGARHRGDTSIRLPNPRIVLLFTALVAAVALVGTFRLEIESAAIRFLPKDHPVVVSFDELQSKGAGLSSIELVLDTPVAALDSPDALSAIARAQRDLGALDTVASTSSIVDILGLIREQMAAALAGKPEAESLAPVLASFDQGVPENVPKGARRGVALRPLLLFLLDKAPPPEALLPLVGAFPKEALDDIRGLIASHFLERDGRLLARLHVSSTAVEVEAFKSVTEKINHIRDGMVRGLPEASVETTGLAPMLIAMQRYLIESQIKSLLGASILVVLVLLFGLRSPRLAAIGCVPNLIPLVLLYGALGWLGLKLDVATVMVGAIALGIAVDDTVHVLSCYDRQLRRRAAVKKALTKVWWPVICTSTMAFAGFMVLSLSEFTPLMKFGVITAAAMAAALVGDLVVLPALLLMFGPRPDQVEFARLSGAGGLLDRLVRRKRAGRLLLELGFTAWRQAERRRDEVPREAGALYQESLGHLDKFLATHPLDGTTRRLQTRAAAEHYRALCFQGLERTVGEAKVTREYLTRIRKDLAGFERDYEALGALRVGALGTRLRAEAKMGDHLAARETLKTMEALSPHDRATVRGLLRVGKLLVTAASKEEGADREDLDREAHRCYRKYLLRNPSNKPEEWERVGLRLEELGETDEAITFYEGMHRHFLAEEPEGHGDVVFRSRQRLARLYLKVGRKNQAVTCYQELVHDHTKVNPYYRDPKLVTELRELQDPGSAPAKP